MPLKSLEGVVKSRSSVIQGGFPLHSELSEFILLTPLFAYISMQEELGPRNKILDA